MKVWIVGLCFWLLAFGLGQQVAVPPPLEGLYLGFVGNQAVVAEFNTDEGLWGRYYFRRDGLDIRLEGTYKQEIYTLSEVYPASRKGVFTLARRRDWLNQVQLMGSYTNGKTRTEVVLRPIQGSDLVSPFADALMQSWKYNNPYVFLKFDQPMQVGRRIRYGRMAFRWYTEPKSGLEMVRLEGYPALNGVLEQEQFKQAAKVLECNLGERRGGGQETSVAWLTRYTLSLRSYTTGCNNIGRVPSSMTFDVRTGRRLALEDLYRILSQPKGYDPSRGEDFNWEFYSDYLLSRRKILVTKALLANPKANLNPLCWGEESGLEATDLLNESWYLSANGLMLQMDFPQGLDECDSEMLVPYSWLNSR